MMKRKYNLGILLISFLLLSFGNATSQTENWVPASVGDLPDNYFFTSMSVVSDNVVWAVANVFGFPSPVNADHLIKVMRTTDGGQTWLSYDVEEAIGRVSYEISAIDASTAWISSNQLVGTDTRPLFKTTDGGETWEQVELDNMAGGVFVHFFDNEQGLAIRNARAAFTSDGGDTWITVPSQNFPLLTGEAFTIFGFSSGNHNAYLDSNIWLGSNMGRVLHSNDYGWTWSATQVVTPNEPINSVAFTDNLHGVAIVLTPIFKMMETFDGGVSWTQSDPAPFPFFTKIANVPNAANTFVVGSNYFLGLNTIAWNQSGITDTTWTYDLTDTVFTQSIQFTSPTNGFAAGAYIDGTNVILKWNGDLSMNTKINSIPGINSTIQTFPSPFADQLNVQVNFDKPSSGLLEIYDLKGNLFSSEHFKNILLLESTITPKNWPAGIYLVKCSTADKVSTSKIIKQ